MFGSPTDLLMLWNLRFQHCDTRPWLWKLGCWLKCWCCLSEFPPPLRDRLQCLSPVPSNEGLSTSTPETSWSCPSCSGRSDSGEATEGERNPAAVACLGMFGWLGRGQHFNAFQFSWSFPPAFRDSEYVLAISFRILHVRKVHGEGRLAVLKFAGRSPQAPKVLTSAMIPPSNELDT